MNLNYENTPTPLEELEDGQEVITSNGAKMTAVYYGWGEDHNVRLKVEVPGEDDVILPEPLIRAMELVLYKKLEPKEYVIVFKDIGLDDDIYTLEEARHMAGRALGIVYRIVPVETEELES